MAEPSTNPGSSSAPAEKPRAATSEKDAEPERHELGYFVEHSRRLFGESPYFVEGALAGEDRQTLTVDQAEGLVEAAARRKLDPYEGAPE